MHYNRRTSALLAAGVLSLAAVAHAEEKITPALQTALSATTISGYVNTSAIRRPGTSPGAGILARAFDGAGAKQDGFNLAAVSLAISMPVGGGEGDAGDVGRMWFRPRAT